MRQEGRGRSLGGFGVLPSLPACLCFLGFPHSSLRHFLNRDPLKGDGGIGPRFPVFGPRWREGAKGKGSKAIGQSVLGSVLGGFRVPSSSRVCLISNSGQGVLRV